MNPGFDAKKINIGALLGKNVVFMIFFPVFCLFAVSKAEIALKTGIFRKKWEFLGMDLAKKVPELILPAENFSRGLFFLLGNCFSNRKTLLQEIFNVRD